MRGVLPSLEGCRRREVRIAVGTLLFLEVITQPLHLVDTRQRGRERERERERERDEIHTGR